MYLCFRCIDGASFYLNWDLDYLEGKQMYYIVRPSPLRFFYIFFFRGGEGRDITDIFVPHIIRTIHVLSKIGLIDYSQVLDIRH